MTLRPKSAVEIAQRARGVPRIGNRLLKRVRDVSDEPTPKQVAETLLELGVDSWGLESCDRTLLMTIYKRFEGGPVGLRTLAAASGLEEKTLAEAYEPYLVGRAGLVDVTEKGRRLTTKGFFYCKNVAARLSGI